MNLVKTYTEKRVKNNQIVFTFSWRLVRLPVFQICMKLANVLTIWTLGLLLNNFSVQKRQDYLPCICSLALLFIYLYWPSRRKVNFFFQLPKLLSLLLRFKLVEYFPVLLRCWCWKDDVVSLPVMLVAVF